MAIPYQRIRAAGECCDYSSCGDELHVGGCRQSSHQRTSVEFEGDVQCSDGLIGGHSHGGRAKRASGEAGFGGGQNFALRIGERGAAGGAVLLEKVELLSTITVVDQKAVAGVEPRRDS